MINRWVVQVCCGTVLCLLGPLLATEAQADARTPYASVTVVPRGDYEWPLAGAPRVVRPYQPPLSTYGPGHRGVDLATGSGALVLTAADGVVIYAGDLAGRGVVSVQHADGLRTTYEPVLAVVTHGDVVVRGQVLGVLQPGHQGCAEAECLHWGLRRGDTYLDPLRLLGRWQVRLKPWVD